MVGLTHWEGEPVGIWKALWGLDGLEVHDTLSSTNDRAKELAREGRVGWWMVLAEDQTHGRGRGEKRWVSASGKSLLFSLLVPGGGASWNTLFPLRIGMAVARGLERAGERSRGLEPPVIGLKWPNDLMLEGGKLAGILCEQGGDGSLVAGVGINLTQQADDFPSGLVNGATSLALALGREVPRGGVLTEVLAQIREGISALGESLNWRELEEYAARDHLFHKEIISETEGRGIASGITPEGYLRLLQPDGQSRIVRAGSVRVVQEPA